MKICTKCGETKNESEFGKLKRNKDGLNYWCKACFHDYNQKWRTDNSEKVKEAAKQWRTDNSEKVKEAAKQWRTDNSEKVKEAAKQWRTDNPDYFTEWRTNNKEKIKQYSEAYYINNAEVLKQKGAEFRKNNSEYNSKYHKTRRANDSVFNFMTNLRARILNGIHAQSAERLFEYEELLGCTAQEAYDYLSSLLDTEMSWENYGEWHVDHIKPVSSFDLTDPEQQKKCFHYTNLQPLWAIDNIKKGNKIQQAS